MSGWRDDAACQGFPTGWWYPESRQYEGRAKQICAACPVQAECLDDALNHPDFHVAQYGIRGGLTWAEQARLRPDRRPTKVQRRPAAAVELDGQMLRLLRDWPRTTRELSEITGVSLPRVRRSLTRLTEAGTAVALGDRGEREWTRAS